MKMMMKRKRKTAGAGAAVLGAAGEARLGFGGWHRGEEGGGVGEEVFEALGQVDFAGDELAVAGDGADGGSFPSGLGGPVLNVDAVRGDAAEGGEAIEKIGGEAELYAEGIFFGLELDEIEVAGTLEVEFLVPHSRVFVLGSGGSGVFLVLCSWFFVFGSGVGKFSVEGGMRR